MKSNWIQRISQSKPMALPVETPEFTLQGRDKIDQLMTEETAEREKETNPEMCYLGSGCYGLAVDCRPGVVCKYTDNMNEAFLAQRAMKENIPYLAKIFNVQLIQENPHLYRIEMEKVQGLNKWESAVLFNVMRKGVPLGMYGLFDTEENITPRITEYFDRSAVDELSRGMMDFQKAIHLCLSYVRMCEMLHELNISCRDASDGNVGWDSKGKLVLFDLGGA